MQFKLKIHVMVVLNKGSCRTALGVLMGTEIACSNKRFEIHFIKLILSLRQNEKRIVCIISDDSTQSQKCSFVRSLLLRPFTFISPVPFRRFKHISSVINSSQAKILLRQEVE